jgi:hypothetical protein
MIEKFNAFDGAPVFHIQAGDNAFGEQEYLRKTEPECWAEKAERKSSTGAIRMRMKQALYR